MTINQDPLRHHRHHANLHSAFGEDRFGQLAERLARFFGTPRYILGQTIVVILWILLNAVALVHHWDAYPFILLNLMFSTQAAYAAPLILLAQTRSAARDKASEEADAKHREQVAADHTKQLSKTTALAAAQLQELAQNTSLTQAIHDLQVQQMQILDLLQGVLHGGSHGHSDVHRKPDSGERPSGPVDVG